MGTGSLASAAVGLSGSAGRAPQQDRGWATRSRLLESAISCLAELGWSGATVSVVAARAGVSRGATQHYFPTREDLFTAALDHMAEVRLAEILREASRLPDGGEHRTRDVVRLLIGLYTGPLFRAALQVWAAAATSAELRDLVLPLEARLGREAHKAAIGLLGVNESRPGVHEAVQATLDLARGLGLADTLADDSRRRERIIAQWAAMLDTALGR
ncbi:MAG TPA: TetR/AcrR family transcriptional regulator [Streptosporangiaceae bacterium]|nr:TetR/AcrR family transcriptional regulator [Streptosporangiaceae bacterium]